MEYHDADDLPVVEVGEVLSREQKLVFALTCPTQLFWLLVWAVVAFAGYAMLATAWHTRPTTANGQTLQTAVGIPPRNQPGRRVQRGYWKRGQRNQWIAYSSGRYKQYL